MTLNELLSNNKIDMTAKKARKILRKTSIKHTTGKAWTFTPAQAKAAVKALAA